VAGAIDRTGIIDDDRGIVTINNITGKVVVITDAGSRLGEATARHLSEQGAIVVLSSEKLHHIRKLVHELAWNGARVIAVRADLRQKTQVKDLVRQAATIFGTVDVLVTCMDAVHGQDMHACAAAHSQHVASSRPPSPPPSGRCCR